MTSQKTSTMNMNVPEQGSSSAELANDKQSVRTDTKCRTEYEQLEFQRKNPHLFTTPTQSVNSDGSITTHAQVTARLREARDKLVANARIFAAAHDFSADYWFLMDELSDTKKHVDYLEAEISKALVSFTENYMRFKEVERSQS